MSMMSVFVTFIAVAAGSVALTAQTKEAEELVRQNLKTMFGDKAPTQLTFVVSSAIGPSSGVLGIFKGGGGRATPAIDRGSEARTEPQMSSDGDIAKGVVVGEKDGELFLESIPCNGTILIFRGKYRKSTLGKVSCHDKDVDKVEVRQK